ncbi:MAG: META domain-containing protein [Chitinophagaceae bacterium]
MKFLFLALTLFSVMLLSCATASKAPAALNGTWALSVFPSGDKTFAEIFGQRRPEITFDASQKQVSGTTGCNRFFGPFTLNKDRISFGSNLGLTKMACPEYDEFIFVNALQQADRYKIAGDQLELLSGDVILMSFTKK